MSKKARILTIIIASAVILIAIATAVILLLQNNKREKTATTIMTCTINPEVQFLLNGNNKVMNVIATNSDGQSVALQGNFSGLTAEEAVKEFVKISVEAGYIDVETDGAVVTIDLNGTLKKYDELQAKIKNSVNSYFDENGIIAGTKITITEDIKNAIISINKNATNLQDKDVQELMDIYVENTKDIGGISASLKDNFYDEYNKIVAILDATKITMNSEIDKTEEKIRELENSLNNIPETLKPATQSLIDSSKELLKIYENQLNKAQDKFKSDYKSLVQKFKDDSKEELERLKNEISTKIEENKTKISDHSNYYNENMEEINNKIAEFRNSINN